MIHVPLSRIVDNPYQLQSRQATAADHVADLAADIRQIRINL